jgi:DNA polymerase elongation subunit (family B)
MKNFHVPMEPLYVVDWYSLDQEFEDTDSEEDQQHEKEKSFYCPLKFLIQAFCIDKSRKTAVVNIIGFQPYFFIRVPDNWGTQQAIAMECGLRDKVRKYYSRALVETTLVNAKPFYGFTANSKFKYMKLIFSCRSAMKQYIEALANPIRIPSLNGGQPHQYELYESNLDPLLRFMHVMDLKACGWISVTNGFKRGHTNSSSNYEIICFDRDIKSMNELTDVPPINTMSFDIEADSSHGDFPLSKKDYNKLARDIVTEWNRQISRGLPPPQHRRLLATFFWAAFHKHYNNPNIYAVQTLNRNWSPSEEEILIGNGPLPTDIKQLIEHFSPEMHRLLMLGQKTLDNALANFTAVKKAGTGSKYDEDGIGFNLEDNLEQKTIVDEHVRETAYSLLDLLEANFPVLDPHKSDYLTLAEQISQEYYKLNYTNNIELQQDPVATIRMLLEVAFNPYYHSIDINRVYLSSKAVVPWETLCHLIPSVKDICDKAYKAVEHTTQMKRFRKCKIKIPKDKLKLGYTVDDCVHELTDILNRYLPKPLDDPIIQIGSTFKRCGESDCYLKHIICLKHTEPIKNETLIDFEYRGVNLSHKDLLKYCQKQKLLLNDAEKSSPQANEIISERFQSLTNEQRENINQMVLETRKLKQIETDKAEVIVECYETEEEVLMAWQKLVRRENPDIVTGYNIFSFDYKYMYDRAQQLGIIGEFCNLGRTDGVQERLIEKPLKSAGMGENYLYIIEMRGRISIDLYKVMQRMHNLDDYRLGAVCYKFLNKTKVDISPNDIFIKQKGSSADRRVVAEYCLIDCILCNRLIDKFELIINSIGMAQVCSVPLSYLFLRGQGIKLFSYVAKRCRQEGFLIPVVESLEDGGKYEGAIVLEPVSGIHYESVAVADFNSLYPSCMISENLSHDSYIGSKIVKAGEPVDVNGIPLTDSVFEGKLLAGDYPGYSYVDIVYDVYSEDTKKKTVIGHKICRFAQLPDGKKSVIPSILIDLLGARGGAKKTRDGYDKGTFQYNVFEGLQLAYKVTANSLYGIIGADTSQIRLKEIAACTTATGRKLINFSSEFVHREYPGSRTIYGDTDSIFCQFDCRHGLTGEKLKGLDSINKCILYCTEAALLISRQLKAPHNLEFEKAIFPFLLVTKKRYHGHYFTEYGSSDFFVNSMGIVLKRRDNAPIVKHVFGGMLEIIMEKHSMSDAVNFVKDECRKVLQGQFPIEMFIVTKTLRSYYKNPDSIAHNVLAQRIGERDPGNKPSSNDRIPYVYIVNPDAEKQGERIETPEFIKANNCRIDYGHYITNQIAKPVIQILNLGNIRGKKMFTDLLQEYYMRMAGVMDITKSSVLRKVDINIWKLWSDDLEEEEYTDSDDDQNEYDVDGDIWGDGLV